MSHIYDFVRVAVFTWLSLGLGFGGSGGFSWLLFPLEEAPEVKLGGRKGDKDLLLALCSPDLGAEGKVEILGRSPSLSFDTAVSGRLLVGELAADIFLAFGLDSSSELSSSTRSFHCNSTCGNICHVNIVFVIGSSSVVVQCSCIIGIYCRSIFNWIFCGRSVMYWNLFIANSIRVKQ